MHFCGFSLPEMRIAIMPRTPFLAVLAAFVTVLGACGKADLPGQPVARVNGQPITEQQLGNELLRVKSAGHPDRGDKALEDLVDRELLQAEAVRQRLDRDPHVAAALANARAEILAQAYLQSRVAYVAAPSRSELRDYFDKHPEKFSARKLFHFNEISLPAAELTGELKAAMDAARTLDDVSAWLDGRRIAHAQARRIRSTSELPDALLARIGSMQVGQMLIIQEGSSALLLAIADIQDSPLDFSAASPEIERLLLSERGQQMGKAELARMRASAAIEYADSGANQYAATRRAGAQAGERFVKASGAAPDTSQ